MTDVTVSVRQLLPLAGTDKEGIKLGVIESAAKAAQNDTWIVSNASVIYGVLSVRLDASGGQTLDTVTWSGTTITLTGAGTGASTGYILYR